MNIDLHKVERQSFINSKDGSRHNRIALFLGDDGSEVHYFDSWKHMVQIAKNPAEDKDYRFMLRDILLAMRDSDRDISRRRYTTKDPVKGGF